MYDYVRWRFGLEFCTPMYLISRELGMLKLSTVWGIRASRFEKRIQIGRAGKIARECWKRNNTDRGIDMGKKKKKYLVRVGWVTRGREIEWNREEMEKEVIERERSKMRRKEEERIKNARYNLRYKEIR